MKSDSEAQGKTNVDDGQILNGASDVGDQSGDEEKGQKKSVPQETARKLQAQLMNIDVSELTSSLYKVDRDLKDDSFMVVISEQTFHEIEVQFHMHDDTVPGTIFDKAKHEIVSALATKFFAGFKTSKFWMPLLEHMKQERLAFEGMGEMDWAKTGMEFEVDDHGQHHAFNHANEVMDTDLIQEGVWQRVKVKTLYPILKKYEYWNNILLKELRGELSVIVQTIYQLAAPHVQRLVRAHFARLRYPKMKLQIVGLARYAAVVEIQRIGRGYFNRREANQQRIVLFDANCIIIQKWARRKLAYLRAHEKREVIRVQWEHTMATKLQQLYRCRLARKRILKRREELLRKRKGATHEWGTMTIQRYARGYLAKKVIVQRRIELKLHDRLLRLADKYMTKGDLWAFLKSVDDDYRRYESTIDDILEREDTMATTFVSKVLNKREEENEAAWSRYEAVVEEHELRKEDSPKLYAQKRAELKRKNKSVVAAVVREDARDENGLADVVPPGSAFGGVPGVALRRAVTASSEALAVRLNQSGIHVQAEFGLYGVDPRTPELRKKALGVNRHRGAEEDIYGPESLSRNDSRKRSKTVSHVSSRSDRRTLSRRATRSACENDSVSFQQDDASLSSLGSARKSPVARLSSAPNLLQSKLNHQQVTWADGRTETSSTYSGSAAPKTVNVGKTGSAQSMLSAKVLSSKAKSHKAGYQLSSTGGYPSLHLSTNSGMAGEDWFQQSAHFDGITNQPQPALKSSYRKSQADADVDRGWEVEWSREMERQGIDESVSTKFPGYSLLRDLPMGMDDTQERLLRAASLRSFVPSTMTASDINSFQAFEAYLSLPPSLAKVRYEQEAWARCQRYIDQLRQMGFYSIQQLMPLSRMITLFKNLDPPMPGNLLDCAKAIVVCLKQKEKVKVLGGTELKNKFKALKDGEASVGQIMHNFDAMEAIEAEGGKPATSRSVTTDQPRGMFGNPTVTSSNDGGDASTVAAEEKKEAAAAHLAATEPTALATASNSVVSSKSGGSRVASDGEVDYEVEQEKPFPPTFEDVTYQEYTPPPTEAEILEEKLIDNVEGWGSIEEPLDNFLTQAAFYVVPHVPNFDTKSNFKPQGGQAEVGGKEKAESFADAAPEHDSGDEEKKEGGIEASQPDDGAPSVNSNAVNTFTSSNSNSYASSLKYNGPGSKMGTTAFTEFCKELVERNKGDPHAAREMMRRRTQASMIVASKFIVRLKESGITKVRDLMQVVFEEWGMPPPLANRAYGMLSTLVANNNALEAGGMYAHINATKLPGLYGGRGDEGSLKSFSSSIGGDTSTSNGEKNVLTREPFDPRFQKSALDATARPARLGPLLPIIHPPGYDKGKRKETDINRMWHDREREKTWEEEQSAEDITDLPGGVWSQAVQFKGGKEGDKSLGIKNAARDPITATPYISRRDVDDVANADDDNDDNDDDKNNNGNSSSDNDNDEGEMSQRARQGGPGKPKADDNDGTVDSFGPVPGLTGLYSGAGSIERPSEAVMLEAAKAGLEKDVAKMLKPETSQYEIPSTTNNLKFNGLFSKGNRIVKKATKLSKSLPSQAKKKGKGLNKNIRGFGKTNMLNDEEALNNRRADDKHYRSWVVPYANKLLDKSQAR